MTRSLPPGWRFGTPALLLLTAVLGAGCSSSAAKDPVELANADTISNGDAAIDGGDAADTLPSASCLGSSLLPGFAAYDSDCAFLAACPKQGNCYCGASCKTEDTLCDPSLCEGVSTTCWCGEACGAQGKKLCPQYVCDKAGDIVGCVAQEQCTFVDKDPPAWCGCVKMPDREPDCWCGPCDGGKAVCSSDKCVGKNPEKCIVVPGKEHSEPYCEMCGLVNTQPKCFFVVVPGAEEGT